MKDLQPGETLIKKTGLLGVGWKKSWINITNGELTLTNRRLVFHELGEYSKYGTERLEISLGDITSVDKESRGTLKVSAGQEYIFYGAWNAKQWGDLINSAVSAAKTASSYAQQRPANQAPSPAYTPPPPPAAPAAQRSRFCKECGSPLVDNPKFCGSCGKRL